MKNTKNNTVRLPWSEALFLALAMLVWTTACLAQTGKPVPVKSGYAPVNGLKMYYEIHGSGEPLLMLHGAYMNGASNFYALLPALTKHRKVILADLHGHGRTGFADRPITYENLADDAAGLLDYLKIDSADVYGYSMGAGTALQLSIRHPGKVKKLVAVSASYSYGGMHQHLVKMFDQITPEQFAGTPFEAEFKKLSPEPDKFPVLVNKLKKLDTTPFDWKEQVRAIKKQTLLMFGDADMVTPEHMADMFRLMGGGVMGDLEPIPRVTLAILPASSHVGVMGRTDWQAAFIVPFLQGAPALTMANFESK